MDAEREPNRRTLDGDEGDPHPDVRRIVEWSAPGLSIVTNDSRCPAGGWCPPHEGSRFGIALVQHGAWLRRANGVEHVADPLSGYFIRAGEIVEVAHFADEVHDGTIIDVDPNVATPVLAEIEVASGPFVMSPQIDLAHRLLAQALRSPDVDSVDVEARTFSVVALVLAQKHPRFPGHGHRATAAARRRLVAAVCERLHQTPAVSLVELARAVHYSPFHLSRVFREVMGVTISGYRTRLRMHDVLLRLDEGANLVELAAEAGFSDHSHMTRTVVAHLGHTPSALRQELRRLA